MQSLVGPPPLVWMAEVDCAWAAGRHEQVPQCCGVRDGTLRETVTMCTSYKAGKDIDLRALFDVAPPALEWSDEIFKDYEAPVILRNRGGVREARLATFGFVPRRQIPQGAKLFDTMNCRTETIAIKRSFSGAWRAGQLCLIPCEAFYEPCYETGKAVRWRIARADGRPFEIAGLWRSWNEPERIALSFTMLTVNADGHPLMGRFHKPGTEKRSVVIVPPTQYEEWLACRDTEQARTFFALPRADEMAAEAAPLRVPTSKGSDNLTLFDS
jgi:putative SOS response-associated peptidase YedK